VTQEADLPISARSFDGWPVGVTGLTIWVTGEIDGEAEVWAGSWDHQRLSGKVDWRVDRDWYESDCQIHYRPHGVTKGTLKIRYSF
jgi:hypothetical protein